MREERVRGVCISSLSIVSEIEAKALRRVWVFLGLGSLSSVGSGLQDLETV